MTQEPMNLEKFHDYILYSEEKMNGELWRFWQLIKIFPEVWTWRIADSTDRQVWTIAICGRNAIWYDDVEEEFVITSYQQYGVTGEIYTQMHPLEDVVLALFSHIKYGGGLIT